MADKFTSRGIASFGAGAKAVAGDNAAADDLVGGNAVDLAGDDATDLAGDNAADLAGDNAADLAGDDAADFKGDDVADLEGDDAADLFPVLVGDFDPPDLGPTLTGRIPLR